MNAVGCGKLIGYEKLAEKLLNEKYDKEFVVEDVQSTSFFGEYYTAVAYPMEEPNTLFKVYVNNDGSGMSDNYVAKLVCAQLSDKVAQNLDSLKGIYYIYSSTLIDSLELTDPSMLLSEYISNHPTMSYNIYLFYCPDYLDKENLYNNLENMFKDLSISGNIYLYIMDELGLKDAQNYLENHDNIYDDGYLMFDRYSCGIIKFTDGMLNDSKEEVFKLLEDK